MRRCYWAAIVAILVFSLSCKNAANRVLGSVQSDKSVKSENEEDWKHIECIAVGQVDDVSTEEDFLHLDKQELVRKALYGHLAPRQYRDIELSVIDDLWVRDRELGDVQGFLTKIDCDGLLRAKITRFDNEFYVTYSATRVGLAVELIDRKNKVIWSAEKTARSDAGTIPLSPVGLATGLFFATRNKQDEIAFQMVDAVVRQTLQSLPMRNLHGSRRVEQIDSGELEDIKKNNLLENAENALQRGDFIQALSLAERLISVYAKDDVPYFLAGKAALGLEKIERSESFFLKAIERNDKEYEYYNGLGLVNLRSRKAIVAREYFSKTLKLEIRDPLAHIGIAESYELQKDYVMAAEYYFRAGTSALTRKDYGSALRSLAALERLPINDDRITEKIQRLRAIISFNRKGS